METPIIFGDSCQNGTSAHDIGNPNGRTCPFLNQVQGICSKYGGIPVHVVCGRYERFWRCKEDYPTKTEELLVNPYIYQTYRDVQLYAPCPECGVTQNIQKLNKGESCIYCEKCKRVFLLTAKEITINQMHEKMAK